MRISAKLTLGLTITSTIILGAYSLRQLRQEEADLRGAAVHDIELLGAAVQVAIGNSLRDRQAADIREILDSVDRRDSAIQIVVFDTQGRLAARSSDTVSVELVHDAGREVISTQRPIVRFDGPQGLAHLIGIFPLNDDDGARLGSIAIVRPLDELRRDLRSTAISTVLSSLTLIAGITGVGWLLVLFHVRRPLASLTQAMRVVRAGDLTASVPALRADELGAVAAEFNSMVQELGEARRQLVEASESREMFEAALLRVDKLVTVGQLSAGLAHEIGSPLQILNGRARALASRRDLPAEVLRSARVLEEQSDRISRIVEQLLSFARRKAAQIGEVDLGEVVGAIVDLVGPEARRRALRMDFECEEGLSKVMADADQVQQVAMNLLSNAFRATARGGRVRLALMASSFGTAGGGSAQASVSLVVEDTGGGIPDQAFGHIFEPFFTTWVEAGGTGLGLAVVKSIVDEHGGLIAVSSQKGSGTRFTVHFPVTSVARGEGMVA